MNEPENTLSINDLYKQLKDKLGSVDNLDSLIPVLFLLSLNGSVFNLKDHFQFEPIFNLQRSKYLTIMCARQVGKSYSIVARNILLSWLIRNYKTLFVLPRFEQTKRLSNDIAKVFIQESPFRHLFVDKTCEQNALKRDYLTKSIQYFQYAFLDADRIRGLSGIYEIVVDECQDLNWDFIPVITETTSAVKKWGFHTYSGTPKTLDNTLTALWEDSSQAEWAVKCTGCGKWNIASLEEDLLGMIGKETCVCADCRKPLNCAEGHFVHGIPERRRYYAGYHVSQIVHPIHYTNPEKWVDILHKQKNYSEAKFKNEVLGTPWDSAQKLISVTDLKKACSDDGADVNNVKVAARKARNMAFRVMGIDWGGGGEENTSYTAITIAGVYPGQTVVEVIYATKLNPALSSWDQVSLIIDLFKQFNPMKVAHDYGGAGVDKETILIQAGLPFNKIVPYTYVASSKQPIIAYNPPIKGYRDSYSLDKTRSIVVLAHMIKALKVKFPVWDSMVNVDHGSGEISLLEDFTYINLERIERPRGGDIMQITKSPKKSDDFVHSVNYACSAIWHDYFRNYPNIAEAEKLKMTDDQIGDSDPSMGIR